MNQNIVPTPYNTSCSKYQRPHKHQLKCECFHHVRWKEKSIKHLDRRYGPYRPGMRFVDYKHNSPSTTSQAALYQHRQVSKVSRDDNIHVNRLDVHTTSQVQQQTESNPDQARHNTNESSNSGSIPQHFLEMDHQLHTEK